jgi:hypothetical protein
MPWLNKETDDMPRHSMKAMKGMKAMKTMKMKTMKKKKTMKAMKLAAHARWGLTGGTLTRGRSGAQNFAARMDEVARQGSPAADKRWTKRKEIGNLRKGLRRYSQIDKKMKAMKRK